MLVTRVHKLVDKKTCVRRYEHIRDFEALLAQSGTTILKFFLHISKEEQLARFAQRLDDPGRNWKISESDYSERELWDDYVDAYEDAISATSTANAPWYVIPANHKWFRNLAVSQIIADTIADLDLAFPAPSVNLADIKRKYHAALEASPGGKAQRLARRADRARVPVRAQRASSGFSEIRSGPPKQNKVCRVDSQRAGRAGDFFGRKRGPSRSAPLARQRRARHGKPDVQDLPDQAVAL